MTKKHTKHSNLTRRFNYNYAPNEVAILGTNCNVISNLVAQVSKKLPAYNLAYFDASHAKDVTKNTLSTYTFHSQGNVQINTVSNLNKYVQRLAFSQHDFLFVNGNHYPAAQQILILDPLKETSIAKRIHQITHIQFVITLTPEASYFKCLLEKFPQIATLTHYTIDEVDKISNHIKTLIAQHIAPVKGLVLTGGKSTRMGADKAMLNYFGKPQKEVAKELLDNYLAETFYSVKNQAKNTTEINDVFLNLGPFGGICSAFQKDPNSAWFVLATDVPCVNQTLIKKLLDARNPSKVATTVKGKTKEFPEPLITIYEPKAYPILLQYLAQGYSCPRKMLINSEIEIIEVEDALIRNINTPEEFNALKKELHS